MLLSNLLYDLCQVYASAGDVTVYLNEGTDTKRGPDACEVQQVVAALTHDPSGEIAVITGQFYDDGHLPEPMTGHELLVQAASDPEAQGKEPALRGAMAFVEHLWTGNTPGQS